MANSNEAGSSSAHNGNNSNWVAIVNLIFTVLIGIAGIVEAVYLNNKNEQAQINLAKLQADLQQQANFSHLEIACSIQCSQDFNIYDNGIASTKKITVHLDLGFVSPDWSSFIDSIDKIQISFYPPELNAQIKPQKNTNLEAGVSKNNEYVISLDNLNPQTPFTIDFNADKYLSSKALFKRISTSTSTVQIYLSSSEEKSLPTIPHAPQTSLSDIISNIIGKYFNDKYFTIASLDVTASCETCKGTTDYINPLSFQPQSFETFSVRSGFVLPDSNISSFQPKPVPGGYMWQIPVYMDYILPIRATPPAIPSSLSLQLKNLGLDNPSINQCQPPDCTNFA